jgi:type VI secretion system protein ImpC
MPREIDPDEPFRILILGDFSGRTNRGVHQGLAGRRTILVDCDNFDEVLEKLQPTLRLPESVLRFRELDDFHPDQIFRTVELFQKLAALRNNPPRPAAAKTAAPSRPLAGLLDDMIDEAEDRSAAQPVEAAGDLAAFIDRAITPHLEQKPEAGRQEWEARVDGATSEQMRNILHHPDFQAMEAAWRAVWMLVHGLGAEEGIEIYLFDATLAELSAEPEAAARMLADSKREWGLLAGNFVFGQSADDARQLANLARTARGAGAPFLAEAQPPAQGEDAEWRALRHSANARWIGLALPRFLLRLPYGAATSPVETLAFEEMTGSVHGEYLWGNPAFACAYLIGQAFRSHGWQLLPGMQRRIDGLPLHVFREAGESVTKPCAEVLLTEHEAEELLESGLMPLASIKGQDAILVVQFCSLADPPAPLAGRWQVRDAR